LINDNVISIISIYVFLLTTAAASSFFYFIVFTLPPNILTSST